MNGYFLLIFSQLAREGKQLIFGPPAYRTYGLNILAILQENYKNNAEGKKVITQLKPEKLFYQTAESDSIFSCEVIIWPRPFLGENSINTTNPPLNKNSKIYIFYFEKIKKKQIPNSNF